MERLQVAYLRMESAAKLTVTTRVTSAQNLVVLETSFDGTNVRLLLRRYREPGMIALGQLLQVSAGEFIIVTNEENLRRMLHYGSLNHLLLGGPGLLVKDVDDGLLLRSGREDGLYWRRSGRSDDNDTVMFLGRTSSSGRAVGNLIVLRKSHVDGLVWFTKMTSSSS